MRSLVDSWRARRLLRPLCALRGHPDRFWLANRWNDEVAVWYVKCWCGARTRREPVRWATTGKEETDADL